MLFEYDQISETLIEFLETTCGAEQVEVKMKKMRLATAILLCAVPNAHARDAAFGAADVMFYDRNCAKLPADFVNAKIKEATGGEMAEATDRLKEAQDLVQANFDDSQLGMKKYCGYQKSGIKCMLYSYRHGGSRDCRTLKQQ